MNSLHVQVGLLLAIASFWAGPGTADAQENNQPPEGFKALFNGKDFDDWTGSVTRDPREIEALPPDERAAWDEKMQRGIEEHWRVEDGVLISDGKEPYLATKDEYGDFEMWVDWKIGPKGDSGIYLRGTPQVQIWDPTDERVHPHGADKGSGGLWNNKEHQRFPTQLADHPIGEWNRMHIRMIGAYVSVTLNDEKVVDNVIMENYYDRNLPIFPRGPIYLQTHGAETQFRNIFLREIPADEANRELSKINADQASFKSLFNGQDLAGWQGDLDSYEVVDGVIRCLPGHHGNLFTEASFDNFAVRFEFRLPPGGNNGLAIRAPVREGDLAYEAMEIQILDNSAEQYKDLEAYQYHGSLYGLAAAQRGYLRPVGEWNFQEVVADGDRVTVTLNGYPILEADLAEVRKSPLDGKQHPGAFRKQGHLALCGHRDPVEFRNLRVKPL